MYGTTILESSLPIAWARAVAFVLKSPEHINFGGGKERKGALDSQTTIILAERHTDFERKGWTKIGGQRGGGAT